MAELKQGRWVKVHEPGQANYVESDNIMDIVIGQDRCQAEALYTVRSYKKAAYWLNEYLKAAEALQIVAQEAIEQISAAAEAATREDPKIVVNGEGWTCEIEKMADGEFKVYLNWAVSEPVSKKAPTKKTKKKAEVPTAEDEKPKKRGRNKKNTKEQEVAAE